MSELYYYILIPTVMVAVGNLALIPFIHLAVIGDINYFFFLYFAILGTVLSDSIWYLVGRTVSRKQILEIKFFRKRVKKVEGFLNFFDRVSLEALFFSKFVWGTRIVVRLLAGVERVNFFKYLFVTLGSSLIWIFGATVVILFAQKGIGVLLGETISGLALTGLVLLLVVFSYFLFKRWLTKKFLK